MELDGTFVCNVVVYYVLGHFPRGCEAPDIMDKGHDHDSFHMNIVLGRTPTWIQLEPEKESDKAGLSDIAKYLGGHEKAGLVMYDARCYLFLPSLDYTRAETGYEGESILGFMGE